MSVDGLAEMAAIKARLSGIAGGRIFEGVLDEETHKRYLTDGGIKPYLTVLTSTPTPSIKSASMTGGDLTTPHNMLITIGAYAGSTLDARITLAAADALLRDWAPLPSATPFSGAGGFQARDSDIRKKPTRFEVGTHWQCLINMGPDS
jgi:hypothetical protein